MIARRILFVIAAALAYVEAGSINHDQVQPFPQPEPVTISEKAALKYKPRLLVDALTCAPYPAVNAAGETSGGLKPTGYNEECTASIMGSQVYSRSGWHNDVWAIMYAWYFPKAFFDSLPFRRHDWLSAVVWIDNPDSEVPQVKGLSLSSSNTKYKKIVPVAFPNGTTPHLASYLPALKVGGLIIAKNPGGGFQDLITWEQLTDAAREALNNPDNFGKADVPLSDTNFPTWLEEAWPFGSEA